MRKYAKHNDTPCSKENFMEEIANINPSIKIYTSSPKNFTTSSLRQNHSKNVRLQSKYK